MSLYITSLNSGSNGNCYYVGNEDEAILVDAGISCREIEKRMARLALPVERIKAVFISHEHTDHIKGLCGLIKKYRFPVYITKPTLVNCGFALEEDLVKNFSAGDTVCIGKLVVTAFKKFHDACDPYSFTVACNKITVGVFTDIGTPCSNLLDHFKLCHAAFLEANYDEQMLDQGNYPFYLKKRIKGGNGHLSNKQALEVFVNHRSPFMSHLVLSHLSKNNNCPELVEQLFTKHAGGVEVAVASRLRETDVYRVTGQKVEALKTGVQVPPQVQLAFSFA